MQRKAPGHLRAVSENQRHKIGCRMLHLWNMPPSCAHRLEQANGFMADFDDGIFSARVALIKPWPAVFELASLRSGLGGTDRVLFIDDHPGNVAATQAHGWGAMRFTHAGRLRQDLAAAGWL